MRVTQPLSAQHLGFMFKKHWRVQGKRVPTPNLAEAELVAKGFNIVNAKKFAFSKPKPDFSNLNIVGLIPKETILDETHPNWKSRPSYFYKDGNVVLEGVVQAQTLTKSIHIKQLPQRVQESFAKTKISDEFEKSMIEAVLSSNVYDAQQEKTAIVKDPLRPAFVFPRNYGITDSRRNKLILSKLILHCENMSGLTTTSTRNIINDAFFIVPYEKDGDLIQMEVTAETFILSKKLIKPFDEIFENEEIPNIFPIKNTITLPTDNIYTHRNVYPISSESTISNPHTILLHFSPLDVKNLHDIPISDTQLESRSLLKAFTVAAAKARSLYGNDVKQLPKSIVVQSVQTDGKRFFFGIYQLNTLNLNGTDGIKNQWFSIPKLNLFSECCYKLGKPHLADYNPDVLKYMKVFYNNN